MSTEQEEYRKLSIIEEFLIQNPQIFKKAYFKPDLTGRERAKFILEAYEAFRRSPAQGTTSSQDLFERKNPQIIAFFEDKASEFDTRIKTMIIKLENIALKTNNTFPTLGAINYLDKIKETYSSPYKLVQLVYNETDGEPHNPKDTPDIEYYRTALRFIGEGLSRTEDEVSAWEAEHGIVYDLEDGETAAPYLDDNGQVNLLEYNL